MGRSITLSKKHGVNPMLVICALCGGDTGEIALLGRLPSDAEAPHRGALPNSRCDWCANAMRVGVLLIEVREGESGDNPYRMGNFAALTVEAVQRIFTGDVVADVLRQRVTYVPSAAWTALGLPRDAAAGKPVGKPTGEPS